VQLQWYSAPIGPVIVSGLYTLPQNFTLNPTSEQNSAVTPSSDDGCVPRHLRAVPVAQSASAYTATIFLCQTHPARSSLEKQFSQTTSNKKSKMPPKLIPPFAI
jgi:hypothetical protein